MVGRARSGPGRIDAGVARSQPQVRERQRQEQQNNECGCGRHPRVRLHRARPARPAGTARTPLFAALEAAAAPRPAGQGQPAFGEPEAVATAAVELEQHTVHEPVRTAHERRDDRQRGEHHRQHRRRSAECDALHEAQAQEQQAEQRDHHGDRSEHDRAPSRVDRSVGRLLAAEATAQLGTEAGHHEERVVDAHTEPDQRRELRSEVRCVDYVAEQRDHAQREPERQQRGDQRQAGGHERAEGEEQHDCRREDTDALGRAVAGAEADDLGAGAAVLDLELWAPRAEGCLLDPLKRLQLEVVGALPVVERGHADTAVLRDLPARREWAVHAGHLRQRLGLLDRGGNARLRGRIAQRPGPSAVDQLVGVALRGREVR